ncbi:CPBP family glutamic-type intramembrane protease [Zunongwangia sp. F363]|uniref:CPBP family glutamic-type intramembrane protease n=1 Tax=Autumnicola tepida TaxID=3075595 RepID=A0ABU3CES6_9FLAO|nr:CPBP family glutamic-type intramembrane protease [Zunongwangia sp. F363]MDT0644857.1 CPBP family glutamic-type intramembrane protease [Zunongwangia sp. F363]
MVACYFGFFTLIGILNSIFPGIDLDKYEQTELFQMLDESPLRFALMALVVAPVLEEGIFRSLIKPSENDIFFFICTWMVIFGAFLIPENVYWALSFALLLVSAILIFLFLKEFTTKNLISASQKILIRYYKPLWLLFAFFFGLVHIYNYVEVFEINIALFLLVFPRMIAGYFFGKVKIENHGLIWPILMHMMNNGIIVFFLFPKLQ